MPVIIDEVSSNFESAPTTRSADPPSTSATPPQGQSIPAEELRRAMLLLAERMARICAH
jgi:hypothetical protein